jgi:retron-type reverse transcriptase
MFGVEAHMRIRMFNAGERNLDSDRIEHSWMIKFVERRVGDRRIVRLIQKWLKAGVMEQGRWIEAEEGTPQGR